MNIGMLAIGIGIIVAVYNLIMNLRHNKKEKGKIITIKAVAKSLLLGLIAYVVVISIDFEASERVVAEYETEDSVRIEYETAENVKVDRETEEVVQADYETEETGPANEQEENESADYESPRKAKQEYRFRSKQLLAEHYEKHGIYMKYKSPEQYLKGANRVIADEDTLHAVEAEDGDDVYYLERTNEFVVVSTDGYIRTYFCPEDGIEYFHRQFE